MENNIINRLILARKNFGMNRKDFAFFLQMSYKTVSNYELGDREPPAAYFEKVADACGVTVDWLLCRTDDPHGYYLAGSADQGKKIRDPDADLLTAYHTAPANLQQAVRNILEPYNPAKKQEDQVS